MAHDHRYVLVDFKDFLYNIQYMYMRVCVCVYIYIYICVYVAFFFITVPANAGFKQNVLTKLKKKIPPLGFIFYDYCSDIILHL